MAVRRGSMDHMLLRITAPHFCAGIADARYAPILAYMRGWTAGRIRGYCAKKGWRLEESG